jgi:HEPN domain-containing protein
MADNSARSFLSKANEELVALEYLVDNDKVVEWIIGFHAQQVAEKVLKAVLIHNNRSPRKVHDLFQLVDELNELNIELPNWAHELDQLNPFAVLLRYETADLAANWDRQEVKTLVVRLYNWAAGEMGRPPYEEYDDFEDYADEGSGSDDESSNRLKRGGAGDESQDKFLIAALTPPPPA